MKSRTNLSVLFDLDGTLLDSFPGIQFAVRSAFDQCQLHMIHSDLRSIIGPPVRTILSLAGDLNDHVALDTLEGAFRAAYDKEGWQKCDCFPDVRQVVQSLSEAGHRLYVVSNKPRYISLKILAKEGILEFFEAIVTRDSRQPPYVDKEQMISTLLKERDVVAADCILVGDTMEDANAAARNGVPFAWATYGYGGFVDGSAAPIAWSLEGISQLLQIVESSCDR